MKHKNTAKLYGSNFNEFKNHISFWNGKSYTCIACQNFLVICEGWYTKTFFTCGICNRFVYRKLYLWSCFLTKLDNTGGARPFKILKYL
jgi:hypothetical protein